jgi:hypothetical protein
VITLADVRETARLIQQGGAGEGDATVTNTNIGFTLATTLDVVLKDIFFDRLATCVLDSAAGTLDRCVIDTCQGSQVDVGVDWDAARVPTNGLIETALAFNTATPFANHVETDALVNRKACLGSAGLLAETPIVP